MAIPLSRQKVLREWRLYLFVVPSLLMVLTFAYFPAVSAVYHSFFDWSGGEAKQFIGLDNYREWFTADGSWKVVSNTVIFTVCAVAGSLVLGLALALLLDRKLRGRNLVRSIVFAPFVLSGAAVGIAFQFVFDPGFGMINDLMHRLGLGSAPDFYQSPGWALFMVTVTYIWKNLGYAFVIYLAALQGKREDLDEAAAIDGARGFTYFRRVLLPQLRPTTWFLSITVLLNSLQVFDIINVMTRGGPLGNGTTTMVYQVYEETFSNFRAGYGATVATIMFLILLVVTVIQVRLMDRDNS